MWEEQLNAAIEAGVKAIEGILKIYNSNFDVEIKDDNSPVTLADKNADKVIRKYLHEKFPTYAFLTEESTDDLSRLENDFVWIVAVHENIVSKVDYDIAVIYACIHNVEILFNG